MGHCTGWVKTLMFSLVSSKFLAMRNKTLYSVINTYMYNSLSFIPIGSFIYKSVFITQVLTFKKYFKFLGIRLVLYLQRVRFFTRKSPLCYSLYYLFCKMFRKIDCIVYQGAHFFNRELHFVVLKTQKVLSQVKFIDIQNPDKTRRAKNFVGLIV